jgi:hypothetical protein
MSAKQDDDALSWAGDDDPTLVAGEAEHLPAAPASVASSAPELPEGWTVAGTGAGAAGSGATGSAATATDVTGAATASAPLTSATGSTATHADPVSTDAPPPPSSVALVGMGVLGGIYLLYTVGWFIGTSRIGNPIGGDIGQFMFSLGAWLAVIAPLVWFGAAYGLTNGRPRLRVLWLLIGVVVLAPLPFIFGVGTI